MFHIVIEFQGILHKWWPRWMVVGLSSSIGTLVQWKNVRGVLAAISNLRKSSSAVQRMAGTCSHVSQQRCIISHHCLMFV